MYYFLHCQCFLWSLWTWPRRGQENVTVSAIHTFFWFPDFWAFEYYSDSATLDRLRSGTLGPSLYFRTWCWFSSKVLDKRELWHDEEQQIIVPIHQNLLMYPLCPREIRSKALSNPMTTEGSGWAILSSRRCPLPMAGGWNIWSLKFQPTQIILWFHDPPAKGLCFIYKE